MKFKEFLYFYGFKTGIALIIAPIAWDVLMLGGRSALIWSVGCVGMLVQIVGIVLMMIGGRDSK